MAYIYLVGLVYVPSNAELGRDLHGHDVVLRVDLNVIVTVFLLILHHFAVRGLHESEEFFCLLVFEEDPDRFKVEKVREGLTHVLEELSESALGAHFSGEFDALDNLSSCDEGILIGL